MVRPTVRSVLLNSRVNNYCRAKRPGYIGFIVDDQTRKNAVAPDPTGPPGPDWLRNLWRLAVKVAGVVAVILTLWAAYQILVRWLTSGPKPLTSGYVGALRFPPPTGQNSDVKPEQCPPVEKRPRWQNLLDPFYLFWS